MTGVYHLPAEHPHAHIVDQHTAAWHDAERYAAADEARIPYPPSTPTTTTASWDPSWREGLEYDRVGEDE